MENFQFVLRNTDYGLFYPSDLVTLKKNIIVFNKQSGQVYDNFDFKMDSTSSWLGYVKLYVDPTDNNYFDYSTATDTQIASHVQNIAVYVKVQVDSGSLKSKTIQTHSIIPNINDIKTVGKEISLQKADVRSVKVLAWTTEQPTGDGVDIISNYSLDNGQRDSFYDFGSIKLKSEVDLSEYNYFRLDIEYFEHGSGYFFIRDSYSGSISYENIPLYNSKTTGKSFSLTDVIDFRPTRVLNDDGTDTIKDSFLPYGRKDEILEVDYEYYLSRIDKIVLSKDRQFKIKKGMSSENPKTPADDFDAMTLYIVTIPPYTYDDNDLKILPVYNRRYTMKDVGILDRKIQDLQFVSNAMLLREQSKNIQIKNSQGQDVFKNGALIDDFSGHRIGDVRSEEYRCSIDFHTGELRPSFDTNSHELSFDKSSSSSNVIKKGPLYMLDYSTDVLIEQDINTVEDNGDKSTIDLNPNSLKYYFGEMKINPASDNWFNQSLDPRVNVNDVGENDAWQFLDTNILDDLGRGFGTQWNDWEVLWSGRESLVSNSEDSSLDISTNNILQNRTTTNSLLETDVVRSLFSNLNRIETDYLNKKVDNSIVPFMRSETVDFVCTNLKSNKEHYAFFDGDNVEDHIIPCSKLTVTTGTGVQFTDGIYDGEFITTPSTSGKVLLINGDDLYIKMTDPNASFTPDEIIINKTDCKVVAFSKPSDLVSDDNGNLCGSFVIPSQSSNPVYDQNLGRFVDDTMRFRTGQRLLRIIDNSDNNLFSSTDISICESSYISQGIIQDPEDYVSSTRLPIKRRSNIQDEQSIFRDSLGRTVGSVTRLFNWKDPLSQTFSIDFSTYRNGVFLESIELFFDGNSTNDENSPVAIELRPTINGFPSTSVVIPFSEVIKNPNEITYGASGTKFTFDVPVYLTSGEYALVIKSNSIEGNYQLCTAVIGQGDTEGQQASNLIGSLFSSSNSENWMPLNNTMLKMKINKCVFPTESGSLVFKTNVSQDESFNLFKFNVSSLDNGSGLGFKYRVGNEASHTNFSENRNQELNSTKNLSSISNFEIVSEFSNVDSNVTPIIDSDRMSVVTVKNLINNWNPNILDSEPEAVYVSKRVLLASPFESKDIEVILDLYKPSLRSTVYVYYKVMDTNSGETDFDSQPWHLMSQITEDNVLSEFKNDYKKFKFGTSGNGVKPVQDGDISEFNVYAIKVVLVSEVAYEVPKVRNLMAIALQETASAT